MMYTFYSTFYREILFGRVSDGCAPALTAGVCLVIFILGQVAHLFVDVFKLFIRPYLEIEKI
jgi:hypothetical protein